MPTEVFELTPQQLDWLYEHQTLKNVDAIHHLDVLTPAGGLVNMATHLTPKLHHQGYIMDVRRDSMAGHESCTASSTSHTSHTSLGSPSKHSPELVNEGIIFPFTEERPTWEQSLANLLSYKERHGVRALHMIEENESYE